MFNARGFKYSATVAVLLIMLAAVPACSAAYYRTLPNRLSRGLVGHSIGG